MGRSRLEGLGAVGGIGCAAMRRGAHASVVSEAEPADGRRSVHMPPQGEETENDFRSVPPGSYVCRVEEARDRCTKTGDPLWALQWVLDEGPMAGKTAAWDNVVFSVRAAPRTRLILKALGLPHEGELRLGAADFVGKRAILEVRNGDFRSPSTGELVRRNEVAYDGVRPLTDEVAQKAAAASSEAWQRGARAEEDGSEIPF